MSGVELTKKIEDEDFTSIDYWKPHFHENCTISLQYYTVDDGTKLLTIYAENLEYPDSQPVVIVPGWFSMISGWTEVTKKVSEFTSIMYVETREKISSILPSHNVDMDVPRMADDFTQITHLMPFEFTDSIVLASSMGGTVMLEYLGRMSPPPSAAVLIGPNAEFDVPIILTPLILALPLMIAGPLKKIIKWYIRNFKVDMEKEPQQYNKYASVLDNAEPWKTRQSGRECLSYNAWDLLESADINTNVILVGATADKMHDTEQTIQIHEVIDGSEFVDFPSNHATHSEEMGEYILDLISK